MLDNQPPEKPWVSPWYLDILSMFIGGFCAALFIRFCMWLGSLLW